MDDTSIIDVLRGKHAYGMTPEKETAWCRVCMLLGFVAGLMLCSCLSDLVAR